MKKFLRSDLFWGLLLTIVVIGASYRRVAALEALELKFYDYRAKLLWHIAPSDQISIVAIDDASIDKLGRFPWPRTRIADMVTQLNGYGAKVVALDIFLTEPAHNPAMGALDRIAESYQVLVSSKILTEHDPANVKKPAPAGFVSPILQAIQDQKKELDEDAKLAEGIAGKNVVLPMYFDLGENLGGKAAPLPFEIARTSMTLIGGGEDYFFSEKATFPLIAFSSAAAGLGHVNVFPDVDGSVRRLPLAVAYGGALYPCYPLEILRAYMGLEHKDIKIARGEKVQLGKIEAPLDELGLMNIVYRGPEHTFLSYSFYEVMNGKVSPDRFKDRIVIIGATAAGVGDHFVTPAGGNFPTIEVMANVIQDLLDKRFITTPSWAEGAQMGLLLLMGLFVALLLPRLKAGMGAVLAMLLMAGILGASVFLFVAKGQWLRFSDSAVLLGVGYLVIFTKRFLTTEKRKELVEASQIETSKMLGLSFQGQGMLDLAFEKFRACPLDETIADLLYNLGLDFERKRQYNKAVAVYEYIGTKFKDYKDTPSKLENLKKASEGAVFGGSVGKSKDATIMAEGASMKPTLGRYEVEKELGRGAMGIVYLGKDPKINRQVAIKTMMLEVEGTPEQVKEIKMRFFREAESAGNLNHPNIVRIFDAGEENEIAYIAMELLSGHDLNKYCEKANLLPLETVLDYCAKTADGLDYAHAAGVVHRDIKPANIMLLNDGSLRITDFGIARIASSSKTATGTVMGTPSYMSPEQVAGKKVDGRADLWSLGVMLYVMCTGEKPFKGGDAIGTLLFQIANDPFPPPTEYRPDLPGDIVAILDKALKKNPDERYQRGSEFAADLRRALERIKSGAPAPAAPAASAPTAMAAQPAASSAAYEKTLAPEAPKAGGPSADKAAEAAQPAASSTAYEKTLAPEAPKAEEKTAPPEAPKKEEPPKFIGASAPASPWDPPAPKAAAPSAPPASEGTLRIELGTRAGLTGNAPLPPAPQKAPEAPPPPPPPKPTDTGTPPPPPPSSETVGDGPMKLELGPRAGLGPNAPGGEVLKPKPVETEKQARISKIEKTLPIIGGDDDDAEPKNGNH